MGTFLLLAVSNHICQNIASIPLLWIAPLSIYLLTFILCFDSSRWYHRPTFRAMLAAGLGVMGWSLADSELTHQLAASGETPGPDLDHAGAAAVTGGSAEPRG